MKNRIVILLAFFSMTASAFAATVSNANIDLCLEKVQASKDVRLSERNAIALCSKADAGFTPCTHALENQKQIQLNDIQKLRYAVRRQRAFRLVMLFR